MRKHETFEDFRPRKSSRKHGVCSANKRVPPELSEFSLSRFFCLYAIYWLSAITGEKKKGSSAPSCVQCATRARAMTHPATAQAHALHVHAHTHVLCTLVRSYDRCLRRYTLRHSDTAVPRKEFLAHARSMSVSVFWILIVSLRSRVRTIAMRRKGASTWSIILIASWILTSNGLTPGSLSRRGFSASNGTPRYFIKYLFNLWFAKRKKNL